MYYADVSGGVVQRCVVGQGPDKDVGPDGWIATPDKVSPGWLYDDQNDTFSAPPVVRDLEAERAEKSLSRFDFATAAASAGYVTWEEAAQWAAGNALPTQVQAVIDALPSEQQGPAMLDALARPEIRRNGSLMPPLASAFSTDDAGLDALFGIAP